MGSLRRPPRRSSRQFPCPRCHRALGACPATPLTAAVAAPVAVPVEREVGACDVVDELVLADEEHALGGDGVEDGGSEAGLGAVEGAYPAAVNAQLQRSTAPGEQVALAAAPTLPWGRLLP